MLHNQDLYIQPFLIEQNIHLKLRIELQFQNLLLVNKECINIY